MALATAHPAKFPDAVAKATGGLRPPLPPHLADLMDRPERLTRVANDQAALETLIRARARITWGVSSAASATKRERPEHFSTPTPPRRPCARRGSTTA